MLTQESDEMKVAAEKLMKLNEDKIAREIAIAREESQWAWEFTKNAEQREARKEGREEGREEEKLEIAKKLLCMQLSTEQIVEATGLSTKEIKSLKVIQG